MLTRWLLRRFAASPRYRAFPRNQASDHRGIWPAWRLGLVLYRRGTDRPPGPDSAARPDPAQLL